MIKPPGIEDIFPDRVGRWNHILDTARKAFRLYNYRELIIPVMEYTEVFARGIGDETDIVSKEMFTFEDRGGRSLTLRPEGTASVVRAYVENGEYNRLSSCKFFYSGPMFRAERPQRGRLRQFNQFGAEFFGSEHPCHDAEIISVMDRICRDTGLAGYRILLNSIGCRECRPSYVAALKDYYRGHESALCPDCVKRLDRNTLRLLDCKNEGCRALKKEAPAITGSLCGACGEHYSAVKGYLADGDVSFTEDPHLVRGLDYYSRTTFEFVAESLGGQNAFAAGGRYDNLVELFGGKPTPAVGFAAGMERLMLLTEGLGFPAVRLDAFLIHGGGESLSRALELSRKLRAGGLSVDIDPSSKGFKSQFKKADREGARFTLIIGEEELQSETCTLKDMASGEQERHPIADITALLIGKNGK